MTFEVDERQMESAMEDAQRDIMEQAMRRWFSASQERLNKAAEGRATIDAARDTRGNLQGRRNQGLWRITQTATPPQWDGDTIKFSYNHPAAEYHEWGTEPHEIRAAEGETLAFEWPDAPDDVVAMFTPGGDDEVNRSDWDGMVYFPEVEHPGNPAIGFVRYGREIARRFLESGGVSGSTYDRVI